MADDISTLELKASHLLDDLAAQAAVTWDMYFDPTTKDVTFKKYNDAGTLIDVVLPNLAKMNANYTGLYNTFTAAADGNYAANNVNVTVYVNYESGDDSHDGLANNSAGWMKTIPAAMNKYAKAGGRLLIYLCGAENHVVAADVIAPYFSNILIRGISATVVNESQTDKVLISNYESGGKQVPYQVIPKNFAMVTFRGVDVVVDTPGGSAPLDSNKKAIVESYSNSHFSLLFGHLTIKKHTDGRYFPLTGRRSGMVSPVYLMIYVATVLMDGVLIQGGNYSEVVWDSHNAAYRNEANSADRTPASLVENISRVNANLTLS